MPAKDHAAWDIGTATRRASQLREPSAEELRGLAQARTAFLAEALAAPAAVRDEYERRIAAGRARAAYPSGRISWILLTIAWLATLVGFGIGGFQPREAITLGVLVVITVSSLVARRNWHRWFAPRSMVQARRCPDCGYDLSASHAEPPLDVARLGVELGPRHCPECGSFWPLVPPGREGPG